MPSLHYESSSGLHRAGQAEEKGPACTINGSTFKDDIY